MERSKEFSKWQWIVLGIIFFSALIALSEAVFGHILSLVKFPYKGGLLTGISFGIIGGIFLSVFRKPVLLMAVGIMAGLIRILIIPILKVSYTCLINGSVGIAISGISVGFIAFLVMKYKSKNDLFSFIYIGAGGAFLSSIIFWIIGMRVSPGKYLLTFSNDFGRWIMAESIIWTVFTAILLPIGFLAGEKLYARLSQISRIRTWPIYVSTITIIIVSFVVTTLICSISF